jgi:AraC-like DNA-binding protein
MKSDRNTACEIRLSGNNYFREKEHFNIKKQTCTDFPLHWHDFFELELVLQGSGIQVLNGETYELGPGSVYLLSPIDYHKVIPSNGGIRLWNAMFDESVLSYKRLCEITTGRLRTPFVLKDGELDCAIKLLELLRDEYECHGEENCLEALFESLLCQLSRAYPTQKQVQGAKYSAEIQPAIMYLEMHFRENPSLKEIAEHVGYHPMYFCKLFKKMTGVTYNERLNQLRIAYAKTLLAQGVPVSETCYACGFGSLSNFQHIFRKHTGHAPSHYKNK